MAKVSLTFDTVSKELAVDIDGVAVENVTCVDVSKSWDMDGDDDKNRYSCCVVTVAKDKEHDMKTITKLCASQTTEATAAVKQGAVESKKHPGFVAVLSPAKSKASKDIENFFLKA